jgi:hypothetical protein
LTTEHLGEKHHLDLDGDIPAHRLAPLTVKGFKVHELIFTQGFVSYCDIDKCGGGCCHSGVFLDTKEYENILAHKNEIVAVMDETQIKDPAQWFDGEWVEDVDFPSGRATGTQVHSRDGGISGFTEGCVFLDKRHFCSIQVAAAANGLHRWAWKPTYCIMFPITVDEGILTYDDSHSEDLHHCGPAGSGNYVHSVFEAMREELQNFLDENEFALLEQYFQENRERFEAERMKNALVQISL